jgi:hypothetical protein
LAEQRAPAAAAHTAVGEEEGEQGVECVHSEIG